MLRNQNGERIILENKQASGQDHLEPLATLNEYAAKHHFKIEFLDIGKTVTPLKT